ncbi:RNA methyltransferase [Halalkalibacillus sediminis]|uniref:RNA methyltransferase n=1 Tax=Halalkalibacillus sediminis TaxID=2018042 RepID=A0A2I0QYN2_9BACI|nr:RNA methyltransferase [Halalkalibacillus sediminis]PKR79240.1 RNA methyltransferase [Halalkalibacillus sediminis]
MIESNQNQHIKQWKKLHKKKYREEEQLFLVEGWHLVEEAMQSEWHVENIIRTENIDIPEHWRHVPVTLVSKKIFSEISQTETPQGIIAVVRQKDMTDFNHEKLLLLDGVQDPGNVGTIIRSALAFGIDAVILGKGSVDLFNEKVLRSTQGAFFHLPVVRGDLNEWVTQLQTKDIPVYGSALDREATPLSELHKTDRFAIVVGNEGSGIQDDILSQVDQKVFIPIQDESESLNVGVATSIMLYHFSTD